ncbi:MAG TPA: hypothetical protein VJJ24_03485 [Candidatus Paceibacterota bacterium]
MEQSTDRLGKMKDHLYRKGAPVTEPKRSKFSFQKDEASENWSEEAQTMKKRKSISPLALLLLVSAVFFVVAVGYAAYSFTSGRNIISADNIEITVTGPVAAKGGEEVTLQLTITNNNTVTLESADLAVIFPEGTRNPEKLSEDLKRFPHYIGTLKPGETIRESVKAVMFGNENEEKKVGIQLQYRTAGSNAIFEKNKEYSVTITSAPVHVAVAVPSEVNSGAEIPIEVTVTSNSAQSLADMYLELTYPDGFSYRTADPKPTVGNNLWSLGDLPSGISRTIKISGVISGNEQDTKGVRATVGLRQSETERFVSVPYTTTFESIAIRRAYIGLNFLLDGNAASEIAHSAGREVRGDITWVNNLDVPVRNSEITIQLSGNALDPVSVTVPDGFYRSGDNSIIWRSQDESSLEELASGEEAHVNFNLASLANAALYARSVTNPNIKMLLTFTGERVSEGFGTEQVMVQQEKIVRINTEVGVFARALYSTGPFANTGAIPPRVDRDTTYTIVWTVSNSTNDVRDIQLTATLPTYVKWLGVVSPIGENITYNSNNGRITWNLGRLEARASKEAAFQVTLTPGISQLGSAPDLVSSVELSGRDEFTSETVSAVADEVNTQIEKDPQYVDSWAKVTN